MKQHPPWTKTKVSCDCNDDRTFLGSQRLIHANKKVNRNLWLYWILKLYLTEWNANKSRLNNTIVYIDQSGFRSKPKKNINPNSINQIKIFVEKIRLNSVCCSLSLFASVLRDFFFFFLFVGLWFGMITKSLLRLYVCWLNFEINFLFDFWTRSS